MTRIDHSEKVFFMKIFLLVLTLILGFQSSIKADDIRDFQIEGMSIGDSLLDHLTEDEIINSKRNYFEDQRKYYVVAKFKNLKKYEIVDIYLKTGDRKYIIRTLGGLMSINLNKCLETKEEIKKEFDEIFSNLKSSEHIKKHEFDKSGNSKQYQQVYYFGDGSKRDNHIRIECDNWSKKIKKEKGFEDGLNIVAMTTEILDWIYSGYK